MIKDFFNTNNFSFKEETSIKNLNTYHVDTKAKFIVYPKNIDELKKIVTFIKENNIKHLVLGNGSNIILSKDYYDGIIIKLDYFNKIEFNETEVCVEAGYSLIKLAIETINRGLSGLEFAVGIPGSVGASTAMNAGAYNSDMSNIVKEVTILTSNLEIVKMTKEELNYSYRDSYLKRNKDNIVISTKLLLSKGNKNEMLRIIKERQEKRQSSQPLNYPSAGSVFRNPEGYYAGELIEKCNLKGKNINGAEVSIKHANFIINTGKAKGKDIVSLIKLIKKEVKDKYNIDLILEQIIVE